jgi:hypothetical protein
VIHEVVVKLVNDMKKHTAWLGVGIIMVDAFKSVGDDDQDTDPHPGVACQMPILTFHRMVE